MFRKPLLTALFAVATLALPPTLTHADDPAPKGDLGKLQGKWSLKVGPDRSQEVEITIKGSDVTVNLTTPDGQEIEIKGQVKLDEAAKPQKTVDWLKFTNPSGEDVPDNHGIYAFDGEDKVKVCNGGPGNPRPTEFKEGTPDMPGTLVMTRKKDAPK